MSASNPPCDFHLRLAVRALRRGGIVAHATEGVWGLACDPHDREAVGRLLELKGRPASKGMILIGAAAGDFQVELDPLDGYARAEVIATWPGAVTWVLPNTRYGPWITGGRATVACRVPGHPQGRALCREFGGALVSTSANATGRPAEADSLRVRRWLAGRCDYFLPGATLGRRGPSEIRFPGGGRMR